MGSGEGVGWEVCLAVFGFPRAWRGLQRSIWGFCLDVLGKKGPHGQRWGRPCGGNLGVMGAGGITSRLSALVLSCLCAWWGMWCAEIGFSGLSALSEGLAAGLGEVSWALDGEDGAVAEDESAAFGASMGFWVAFWHFLGGYWPVIWWTMLDMMVPRFCSAM